MGMPNTEQTALPEQGNGGYLTRQFSSYENCPKYNWTKMDACERMGVNLMDAVGAKNAVFGGLFGIFIFAIVIFFFRTQVAGFLTEGIFKIKGKGKKK